MTLGVQVLRDLGAWFWIYFQKSFAASSGLSGHIREER